MLRNLSCFNGKYSLFVLITLELGDSNVVTELAVTDKQLIFSVSLLCRVNIENILRLSFTYSTVL